MPKDARAEYYVQFIAQHATYVARARNGAKKVVDATTFGNLLKQGKQLTPSQYNYLEAIYELAMKQLGFGGAPSTHDNVKQW